MQQSDKKTVMNAVSTLRNTYEFFAKGGTPGCLAGERFVIVRPDGQLNACWMYPEMIFKDQQDVLDHFSVREECAD